MIFSTVPYPSTPLNIASTSGTICELCMLNTLRMDRTGFIKTNYESIEQATRLLNTSGYNDTLVIKENGIYSTSKSHYLKLENLSIYEAHRTKSKQNLVRVLFAIKHNGEPMGTVSIACGATYADAITKVVDLLVYFKLENQ